MERLDLPYRELGQQWLSAGLNPPAELLPVLLEKHALIRSIHRAHPDTPCRACGNCCPTFPFTTRYAEYRYIMAHLEDILTPDEKRTLVEERAGRVRPQGYPVCPFLGGGRCSVYQVRPMVCRRAVAGESICLEFEQGGTAYVAWTGREESFRFLAVNCLVNFLEEEGSYREIGIPVPGRGVLSMAPFEFWFLLDLGRVELVLQLLATPGYRPPLQWVRQ